MTTKNGLCIVWILKQGINQMWSRSAQNKITGLITVECVNWNGEVFFHGEFDNLAEAERAGANAERQMTLEMTAPKDDSETVVMSDDELLAALLE